MLGHVWTGVGEEYKLTGFGYTLIFFTVLLWSIDLVPFWITCAFRVYTFPTNSNICSKLSTTTTVISYLYLQLPVTAYQLHINNLPAPTTSQQLHSPAAACQQLQLASASSQQLAAITTYFKVSGSL